VEHTDNITHLTEQIPLLNGSRILYCYDSVNSYLDNALAYLTHSVEHANYVFVIDNHDHCEQLRKRLLSVLSAAKLAAIQYVDSALLPNERSTEEYLQQACLRIQTQVSQPITVRVWAHEERSTVSADDYRQNGISRMNNSMLADLQSITVHAYPAWKLSGSSQLQLLKHHDYMMTDHEFVQSPLSANSEDMIFPSLSQQAKLESEMNLFRQKLDFVHVISHEVRNPLTIMKAFAAMVLAREQQLSDYSKEKIRAISEYVDVIDNEINHIIYTEQMLSGEELWGLETIHNALPLIHETIDFMCIKARSEGIKLQASILANGPLPIRTSVIGLKLILSNLLSNAIKYSEDKAVVHLCIDSQADQLIIEVQDEGFGMDDEQLSQLFRKYGKMNFERSGQGIGLYMVKKLVDYLRGTIQVHSQLEQGTRFLVKLPLSPSS